MINFRYHVVSLTAVFLALVIGVAMGSTVISKATVDGLRSNVKRVENRIDDVQAQNSVLRSRLSAFEKQNGELTDQMLNRMVADSLTDKPVLMIASKGIDQASLDQARTTLVDAGARFDGTLLVDDRLALTGANATKLGQLLNADPKQDVRSLLIDRLATVLDDAAVPPSDRPLPTTTTTTARRSTTTTRRTTTTTRTGGPTTSAPSSTTTTTPPTSGVSQPPLITALRASGYLGFKPPDGGSPDDLVLTTQGYRYVVVSGPAPNVPNDQFLFPLLRAMAAQGKTSVVAASGASGDNEVADRVAFVGPIRADPTMSARISTVDDLERFTGQAALAFAVREVPDNHGHYGFGKGADALFPTPPP